MRRARILMVVWIVWGAMNLSGSGQALPDSLAEKAATTPTAAGVIDDSGVFNRNTEPRLRISENLCKLEANHGFRILLKVEPVLISTNAPDLAEELQQSWLPAGGGLVVVYESDSGNVGFGRNLGRPPDNENLTRRIPAHAVATILQKSQASTDIKLESSIYIETLMGNLVTEFDSYLKRRDAPPPAGRSLRLGLLAVGAITLLALIAIIVGSLTRLPSIAGPRSYRFPVVDRPERLGAPFGGGNVTTRRFGGNPKS